ncbi:putative calcium-dependent protein kinase [Carex littledalei]|uniref:Putative calcium-dependent protein kinase n=1 Tax=Carex littledalei TaxID=544730 RepID=A0A833VCS5_9POAL|nr:putative calcium-dependent protein kinase [Carex littledalei]
MESPMKKRRSSRSGSASGPRSGGDTDRRIKKSKKQAPAAQRGSPDGACRGLKRKSGCIEVAAQFGRKKNLDQYYSIGEELGCGKFGSVRICYSKLTGEHFACKALLKDTGEENTAHIEVEIMQHLSGHPGVVTLKEVFDDTEKFYIIMELCSGGRLSDFLVKERARFCERNAAEVVKELMGIVKYCHEMGVVHRDIKPENILLTESGRMKLADFGLATRLSDGQKLSGFFGSPAYVSPEVLTGYYNEKTDIWGVGVLLHFLLLGYLPFGGASREAIFEAVKTIELDFHGAAWQSVSLPARDLLSRMLTHDVSARLSANEVLGHPWFTTYADCSASGDSAAKCTNLQITNNIPRGAPVVLPVGRWSHDSSQESHDRDSSQESHDGAECEYINALTAAVARIEISEPKRSRICGPVPTPTGLGLKTNLCTAF